MSAFWVGYLAGVSQNFVASLVLGIPAFVHLHKTLKRHHRQQLITTLSSARRGGGDGS